MNDEQKEMTQEEAEEDFKNAVADVFSKQVAGVYRDADGFTAAVPTAAMGLYPTRPSKPSPGICSTSSGDSLTIVSLLFTPSSADTMHS